MKLKQSLLFAICLLLTPVVHAETRYVTDEFQVMLRTGPSLQNKIIRAMSSGVRVEVLREEAGNGHSQVQTSKGEIGYVLTRFLSNSPSARDQLFQLQSQLKELRSKPGELRSLLAKSQDENKELIEQNVELTRNYQRVAQELKTIKAVSEDAVNLADKNKELSKEVQQLLLQIDDVRIQNEALKDQSAKRWFMLGASAILLGLFFGWLLSMSKGRRQRAW